MELTCPGRRLKADNGLLVLCISCARQDDSGEMEPAACRLVIGGEWQCQNFVERGDDSRELPCRLRGGGLPV